MPDRQLRFSMKMALAGSALCLLFAGCAGRVSPVIGEGAEVPGGADMVVPKTAVERPGTVRRGDLVRVRYGVTPEDGSPAAGVPGEQVPLELLAGEQGAVPGLGEGVIGMAAGERKRLVLAADKAYGERDERKVSQQQRVNAIPLTFRVPAREYVERFNSFPAAGRELPLFPYVTTRVGEVGETDVRLDISARDGARFEESFGTVELHVTGEKIELRLEPRVGAPFPVQGEEGRVTAVDNDSFTVDFNHPLAGKGVVVDFELISLATGDSLKGLNVSWQENHDQGLAAAREAGKPAVLVLYADWCQWCGKLFGESVQDPRVKVLAENFVWVRANSDRQAEYKTKYGQDGFPLIVLFSPDGTVSGKIEGFRDGAALAGELRAFLAAGGRKPVL